MSFLSNPCNLSNWAHVPPSLRLLLLYYESANGIEEGWKYVPRFDPILNFCPRHFDLTENGILPRLMQYGEHITGGFA
jgi:hypothetical protein